jgi:hypothetical protein
MSSTAPTATFNGSGGEEMGISVSMSSDGTTALVGALTGGGNEGAVFVFHVANPALWSTNPAPVAVLTNATHTGPDDWMGASVTLSADGTTAFIGATNYNNAAGAVFVFHVPSEDAWATSSTPTATLTNAAGGANNEFGQSLAVSSDGTTAIIGSSLATNSGKGDAFVFHVPSETAWASSSTPTAALTDAASTNQDGFGQSVSISGDGTTAVVGTYVFSGDHGYATVFHTASEDSWVSTSSPTATLTNPSPAAGDNFGLSVSLSADGTTALIGSPGVNTGKGAAFVFRVQNEGAWVSTSTPLATLTNAAVSHNNEFGAVLALSADGMIALIGGAGPVAVFQTPSEGSWATSTSPTATLSVAYQSNYYAVSLSADGSTALVGDGGANSYGGAAYLFNSRGHGYWLVGADGGIFSFGGAQFHGSTGSLTLQRPVVGITPVTAGGGYWLAASDGGVFAFDAGFFGSIPGLGFHPAGSGLPNSLNAPIVGMVPSADGDGYFMVASDGGVFAFGDARFEGSCPGIGGCSGAAVAVMPDASGGGYWVITKTGNVYAFGDAQYYGAPGPELVPVTSAARTPDGRGYWILYGNGVVVPFGDAVGGNGPISSTSGFNPATAIFAQDAQGYWVGTANGAVYPYGDAQSFGSMAGTRLNAPIIAATGF